MKKALYIVVALVILFGVYTTFSSKDVDIDRPVKIGIVLPLSGGAAFLGESAQKAAQLAIKDAGDGTVADAGNDACSYNCNANGTVKCSGRGEHEEGAREACVSTRQRDREVVAPLLTCPLLFLKRPLSRHQNVAFDALFLVLC